MSLAYLETRGMDILRRTMLLIDARHGVKPQDEEVMAAFDARAVPYQVLCMDACGIGGSGRGGIYTSDEFNHCLI